MGVAEPPSWVPQPLPPPPPSTVSSTSAESDRDAGRRPRGAGWRRGEVGGVRRGRKHTLWAGRVCVCAPVSGRSLAGPAVAARSGADQGRCQWRTDAADPHRTLPPPSTSVHRLVAGVSPGPRRSLDPPAISLSGGGAVPPRGPAPSRIMTRRRGPAVPPAPAQSGGPAGCAAGPLQPHSAGTAPPSACRLAADAG